MNKRQVNAVNQAYKMGEQAAVRKLSKAMSCILVLAYRRLYGSRATADKCTALLEWWEHYCGQYVKGDLTLEQMCHMIKESVGLEMEWKEEA